MPESGDIELVSARPLTAAVPYLVMTVNSQECVLEGLVAQRLQRRRKVPHRAQKLIAVVAYRAQRVAH